MLQLVNKELARKFYPFDFVKEQGKLSALLPWADFIVLNAFFEKGFFNFPEKMVAVEIGAWTGFTTCLIATHVKERGGHLYTIDNFFGQPENSKAAGNGIIPKIESDAIFNELNANLENFRVNDAVTVLNGNSDEFVTMFDDNSIDFMFIDGDHRYSQFSKELRSWYPKIKINGVLSGHDFNGLAYDERFIEEDFVGEIHHGVTKALGEFKDFVYFKGEKGEIISSVWHIKKTTGATLSPVNTEQSSEKVGRDNDTRTEITSKEAGVPQPVGATESAG